MGVFDLFKKKPDQPEGAGQGGAEEAPQPGLFGMLRSALKKTTDVLNTDIRDLFKREGRLVDSRILAVGADRNIAHRLLRPRKARR